MSSTQSDTIASMVANLAKRQPVDPSVRDLIKADIQADPTLLRHVTHRPDVYAADALVKFFLAVYNSDALADRVMTDIVQRLDWLALVREIDLEDTARRAAKPDIEYVPVLVSPGLRYILEQRGV